MLHKCVDKFQCLGVLLAIAIAIACSSFLAKTSNVKL